MYININLLHTLFTPMFLLQRVNFSLLFPCKMAFSPFIILTADRNNDLSYRVVEERSISPGG